MSDQFYTIETATQQGVDTMVAWAAEEGWNPGLQDSKSYYSADPQGFFMGFLNDQPIASLSAVKYDESFGFIGFHIVQPEYRGKGYGSAIWDKGIRYLAGCNIGLDSVLDQQQNYIKSGFKLAFSNIRYKGKGGGVADNDSDIFELSSISLDEVINYDQAFFPAKRSHFISHWISQPGSIALGIKKDHQLAGYGVIRPCLSGYKIGPLYADDAQSAESLFYTLRSKVTDQDLIYLDIPEINQSALKIASSCEMVKISETARMYTGLEPSIPNNSIYSFCSSEIG